MADYSNDAFIIRDLNDKWVIYTQRRRIETSSPSPVVS